MLTNETISKLQNMRLSIMARQFKEQMDDPQFAAMSFEDRFSILVDAEWSTRKSNHLKSLIKNAGYVIPGASVEDIEYLPDRKLDKSQILRLASCAYIQEAHNVIGTKQPELQRPRWETIPLSALTGTNIPFLYVFCAGQLPSRDTPTPWRSSATGMLL